MEFRILGPLEAWDGGSEISLGGPKPRALLTLLLLHANEVVPADRLIDDLWGEDLPEDGAAALRVNVSRLRKALPQDVLTTRSPGYVVRVDPGRAWISTASSAWWTRAGACSPAASRRTRRSGCTTRWRSGEARRSRTSPTRASPRRRSPGSRRSGWRPSSCGSTRTSRSGATTSCVPELEALVASYPLRERLRRDLMTALYRSGRQAEALEAYQGARRALVDGLGIEPGRALQELERRDPPARPVAGSRSGARSRRPGCRRAGDPRRHRR